MHYRSAIITINRITLAAILVDPDQTYPAPGAALIAQAQRHLPPLPIILVSPRISGFSRSFAHFDTTNLIKHINTDDIEWVAAELPPLTAPPPF